MLCVGITVRSIKKYGNQNILVKRKFARITLQEHLSRIESNQVVPSFELMEHLLKQVGLDFEEFRYICHSYHHSDREEIILLAEDNNASPIK